MSSYGNVYSTLILVFEKTFLCLFFSFLTSNCNVSYVYVKAAHFIPKEGQRTVQLEPNYSFNIFTCVSCPTIAGSALSDNLTYEPN